MKVYGQGVKEVKTVYRPGKENKCVDALSRCSHDPAPTCGIAKGETQVVSLSTSKISELLEEEQVPNVEVDSFSAEQWNDMWICDMVAFLQERKLPHDDNQARAIAAQSLQFDIIDGILYFMDNKHANKKCVVVPRPFRQQLLHENHSRQSGAYFSKQRTFNRLALRWDVCRHFVVL